jgi:hypothetical protein
MTKISLSVIVLAVAVAAPAFAKTQNHKPISDPRSEVRASQAFASAIRSAAVPEPTYMAFQTRSLIAN